MKTVLNKHNVDSIKQPLFLGKDLAIQRYDRLKYPKFYELYDQQLNFFWRPQEVNLTKDASDYKKLSDEERFVFDSNLKFQTMGDSMLSRSIHQMMHHVSNPELEICMNVWSFFETIHSNSYTYILQNVYPDATKFFEMNQKIVDLKNPLLTDDAKQLVELYYSESLDPEGRTSKNFIQMMHQDGFFKYLPKDDDSFVEFIKPLKSRGLCSCLVSCLTSVISNTARSVNIIFLSPLIKQF